VAAHTVHQRIEGILVMPNLAIGMAAGILAGQNLGAGQPERAAKTGWRAVGFAEAIFFIGSVIMLLWAENLVRIFSSNPGVVELCSDFLRIATAGYIMLGLLLVLMQCLTGIGDTMPPLIISLIGMWVIQLPLAYFLSKSTGFGVYGVRWATVTGTVFRAIAYVTYFLAGRWKRKTV